MMHASVVAPVVAIVGPTATGKTGLSVQLAQQFNAQILSADSQLVYKYLSIGTAKPTMAERQGIVHHGLDLAEPDEVFGVARYQAEAMAVLQNIQQLGTLPIIVGGTGFYLRAVLQQPDMLPSVPPNPEYRQQLSQLADKQDSGHRNTPYGNNWLHQLLTEKDPRRAAQLHPNDRVRVLRALEIIEATGQPVPRPVSQAISMSASIKPVNALWLGLTYANRDEHRAVIRSRIQAMMQAGWLAEVETLLQQYGPNAQALRISHGYPELVQVLQGQRNLPDALEQININVRQYARRQRTWFNRQPQITWLNVDEHSPETLFALASKQIADYLHLF